mmetsp:Transcript_11594/g.23373  ORF Transcript_11594/g.23373 Transcript_11594/m.23373 type:complete len:329 (+) Transcript_11594:226-1212(+)
MYRLPLHHPVSISHHGAIITEHAAIDLTTLLSVGAHVEQQHACALLHSDALSCAQTLPQCWHVRTGPCALARGPGRCPCTHTHASCACRCSVVEEAQAREGHGHAVLVCRRDHLCVCHGAPSRDDVRDSPSGGHVDGITEGEEGVGCEGDASKGCHEFRLLGECDRLRHLEKLGAPLGVLGGRHVALDVAHTSVDPLLSLDALFELEGTHLGMLPHVPCLHLATGELDAIDAALLARSHTNHLPVARIANRVGLGVLDRNLGDEQVTLGLVGQVANLSNHFGERSVRDSVGCAALGELGSEDGALLVRRRLEGGVSLQHDILAALFSA